MARITIWQIRELLRQDESRIATRERLDVFLKESLSPENKKRNLIRTLLSKARRAAGQISNAYEQSQAYAAIAEALAKVGNFDEARRAAGQISDAYEQSQAYAAIAEATKEEKDFDEARRAAGQISNAYEQSQAYAAIAGALVKD